MEKRAAERFEMKVPATLSVHTRPKEVLRVETENVSSKGAFLRTDRSFAEGIRVDVELHLALSEPIRQAGATGKVQIKVAGRVVRREPGGIAVEFGNHYRISSG